VAAGWSADALARIDAAGELDIAVRRPDGTLRRWTPIWLVRVGDQVYVRSWYRRDTGWFGQALTCRQARIRVPGQEAEVAVEDVGAEADGVDGAYRAKYGPAGSASMITPAAAATTLRLVPRPPGSGSTDAAAR
jgi:hypothetical protein